MTFLQQLLTHNWKIKFYALTVSLSVWFIILGQRPITFTREVHVNYILDSDSILEESVDKVVLSLEAKRSLFKSFDFESLAPVMDLRGHLPGPKRLPIQKNFISLPVGVKLVSVEPKYVNLYLRAKTQIDVNKGVGSEDN